MHHYLPLEVVRQSLEFANYYQEASRFCILLEESTNLATADFLAATRSHLIQLYVAGLHMPWVDLQSNVEYEEKLRPEDFEAVLSATAKNLGEARYYWHVFDPTSTTDTSSVCGDLLDDLGDIYKDLKYSLMIFNLGKVDCEENALWQFKCDFHAHWSRHFINAMTATHFHIKRLER